MGRTLRLIVLCGTPAAWAWAIAGIWLFRAADIVTTGVAVTGSVTWLGDHNDRAFLLKAVADAVAVRKEQQRLRLAQSETAAALRTPATAALC